MHFSYIQDTRASALIIACEEGHTEVAAVLIARGATVDYKNKVRQSCMMRIMSVVFKNGMMIGIWVDGRHVKGSSAHWIHAVYTL